MVKTNENEISIKVEHLSVRYKSLHSFSIKKNLFHLRPVKRNAIEAVRDISFEVKNGEILGIIGRNGCGKSTLLKTLANIFSPDEGYVETFGKSISLLAIGVGFEKQLSGRDNIMLSGLALGFDEKFIRNNMDQIIEFSEIGEFIDKPVSTYSSGMYSKLAFSIAAFLETDIMLVDEVLSVGDQQFKRKSMRKMKQLIADENRTVVIVSHSIGTLRNLCDKVMWMDSGKIQMIGAAEEVLDAYEEYMDAESDKKRV